MLDRLQRSVGGETSSRCSIWKMKRLEICGPGPHRTELYRQMRVTAVSHSRHSWWATSAITFRDGVIERPLAQADLHEQGSMLVRETNRTYEVPGDSEQIVRAAWLYHVAGNTQEQTADLLGISRVKVNRLLAEAREFGIVKISIEHRFARMVEVEEKIRRRHNLTFCRTTPPIVSYSPARRKTLPSRSRLEAESPIARRAVAIVAAELLRERLQADESSVIGVGWGEPWLRFQITSPV